jgi:hypothetical protein
MNGRALTSAQNKSVAAMPLAGRSKTLQRKCACGNHVAGGAECAECSKAKQRLPLNPNRASRPPQAEMRGKGVLGRKEWLYGDNSNRL